MTVPTETSYAELSWTGVETTFAPGIRCNDTAHITVGYLDDDGVSVELTASTHYAITRDTGTKVITVTPIALPAAPRTLTFKRRTPALQATDFAAITGGFSPAVHTDLHDAAAMRAAELWFEQANKASWSPELAIITDGARRVVQVVDWIGGIGDKPDIDVYLGATGYVADIADAVDVRGPIGTGAGTGNVNGPVSSIDGNVAGFDGTGGNTIKDLGTFASLLAGLALDNETSVAGAAPCDIGAAVTTRILITGGAGDVSFSAAVGRLRIVRFPVSKTLKHNATSLVLLTGADRVTAAGDQGLYVSDSSGNWRELAYQRADGKATITAIVDADVPTDLVTPRMLAASALAQGICMLNGTITGSRAAGAETIEIKTLAGTDPSAADPVLCAFPNLTGGFSRAKITAALALTIPSGAELGCVNAIAFNLTHLLILDGSTVRLGVIQCKDSSKVVLALDAYGTIDTVAIGTGSDSAQVCYSSATLSAAPYAVIGRSCYAGLAAVGTWDVAPSKRRLAGMGFVLPGREVKSAFASFTSTTSNSGAAGAFADSGLTKSFQMGEAANLVRGTAAMCIGNAGGDSSFLRAMRDTTALDVAPAAGSRVRGGVGAVSAVAGGIASAALGFLDAPNDASAHTFKVQFAPSNVSVAYINRSGTDTDTTGFMRGVSTMNLMEIQA